MNVTSHFRLRTRLPEHEVAEREGRIPTDDAYDVLLTGPTMVRKPDHRPLAVFLPGAVKAEMDAAYPVLTTIRDLTENRGAASGSMRAPVAEGKSRAKPIMSAIAGAFESSGHYKFCRLTAFTAREVEKWRELGPLFRAIAGHLAEQVPDRFAAQAREAAATAPEWVVPGTPFTTITINNSYPTGIHTDKGDLDAGFSCLAVARRGEYAGGRLVFPRYRVAADMGDGDLILMDAHDWHSNTALVCACGRQMDGPCVRCGAERISVVCYYRTRMRACGTLAEEEAKRLALAEG